MPIPPAIDVSSQTERRLRYGQVRELNTFDYVEVWHDLYAAADIPGAIDPNAWSAPLNVKGYDALFIFVQLTRPGGAGEDVSFAMESSFTRNAAGLWYSRATAFNVAQGDTTTIADSFPTRLAADGSGNFVFRVETVGHYMRIQPVLSAVEAGSRAVISVQRAMFST